MSRNALLLPMACWILTACAGSAASIADQREQAACPPNTLASDVTDKTCPPCQTQPCPQPVQQPPYAPEASDYPIPGSGFYCASFRKPPGSSDYQEICYRAAKTCKTLRKRAITSGYQVSTCESKDAAHCFTMVDEIEQKVYWRCYELPNHCTAAREEHREKYGVLAFSDCRLTAEALVYESDSTEEPSWLPKFRKDRAAEAPPTMNRTTSIRYPLICTVAPAAKHSAEPVPTQAS